MGNNPQKLLTYGAVHSLYITRLVKLVNKKGKLKSSLIFDEFPTIYLNHMDSLIATARSNMVSTTLGIQDFSQLRKDYGKEQADVIMNITGNIISGQVSGDTAKQLSERFGKIMQDRTSFSINRTDTSISRSTTSLRIQNTISSLRRKSGSGNWLFSLLHWPFLYPVSDCSAWLLLQQNSAPKKSGSGKYWVQLFSTYGAFCQRILSP